QPDGAFVSLSSMRSGRVKLVEGASEGCVELEGVPDMVLEVVSTSSVLKDTEVLRELYWRAGIPEYWLVDARGEAPQFEILRRTTVSYVATRKQAGWLRSRVLGKSFRLTRHLDESGQPDFKLSIR